jgi:hypothetical protein
VTVQRRADRVQLLALAQIGDALLEFVDAVADLACLAVVGGGDVAAHQGVEPVGTVYIVAAGSYRFVVEKPIVISAV